MRFAAIFVLVFLGLTSCWSGHAEAESPFVEPNTLMAREIDDRIAQVPYQQREELFNNLLWLAQTGEMAIPSLLTALQDNNPKVRSNALWVLGRIRDRRTVPQLQPLVDDSDESVRLEAARSLVLLGDLQHIPVLVEGLDSSRTEVRYYCNETLKNATGRSFGYDHLDEDAVARQQATYRWRKWWSDQSGDPWFAKEYATDNGLDVFEAENQWLMGSKPAPMGETSGLQISNPNSDDPAIYEDGSPAIIEIIDPNEPMPNDAPDGGSQSPQSGWVRPVDDGSELPTSRMTVTTTPKN